MISTLISLIFVMIILGVGFWAIQKLIALVPMAEPFNTIVHVVLVLIGVVVVLWIIAQLLVAAGIGSHPILESFRIPR